MIIYSTLDLRFHDFRFHDLRFLRINKTEVETAIRIPAAAGRVDEALSTNPVAGRIGAFTYTFAKAYPRAIKPFAVPCAVATFLVEAQIYILHVYVHVSVVSSK